MIYFLYGPNSYSLLREQKRLSDFFVQKYGADGLERVDGETLSPDRLGELLQGVTLFSSHRMVILKGASQQKALWDALGEWLDKVPDETILVIVEPQADKRTKTFKALQKVAKLVSGDELNEVSAVAWLVDEAKRRNAELSKTDARYLVDRVGLNQARLSSELDKLVLHEVIDRDLIDNLTEASPHSSAFELLDAVLARKSDRAKRIIDELKASEDPYKLFGLFSSQVHTLALVVAAGGKIPAAQIAKDSGIHAFVIGKMAKIASGTNWSQVRDIITITAELDRKTKTTGADPWLLLETSLMRIAAR